MTSVESYLAPLLGKKERKRQQVLYNYYHHMKKLERLLDVGTHSKGANLIENSTNPPLVPPPLPLITAETKTLCVIQLTCFKWPW